jgi:D-hydroxyproline dehydrogenase subunit gamma
MVTDSLFRALVEPATRVHIEFDGQQLSVAAGLSLAAALLGAGVRQTRRTPVSAAPRAPFCMMGVCFECLVEVNGQANCQACLLTVEDGMQVRSQQGARHLPSSAPATEVSEHDA